MADRTTNIEKLLVYYEYWKEKHLEFLQQGGCPVMNTAIDADDTHPADTRKAVITTKSISLFMPFFLD